MPAVPRRHARAASAGGHKAAAEPTRAQDFRLKPEHASPLLLKRRGLRRAKALLCQRYRTLLARLLARPLCPQKVVEDRYHDRTEQRRNDAHTLQRAIKTQ